MNIEILNSIHGGVVLSINNYLYIKNKDYIRKIDDKHIFYWTCEKQCGAKIRTFCENNEHYIDKNFIFSENHHSHGADPISVGARKIKENIKKCARENQDKPIQIYHVAIAGTSQTINSKVSKEAARQIIKRQRRNDDVYLEPQTADMIDLPLYLCKTLSGNAFLVKKTNEVLLFTTYENCTFLQESNCWIADGTFKVCPNIFYQLYVIHGLIKRGNDTTQHIFVPLVYALMTSKTEELYVKMFKLLIEFCNDNNQKINDNPDLEIVTDFEKGAINALNDMFPLATHSACFFHLSQNIYKKLQSLGLSSRYSNDPEFNLLAKQISALAFLPANMVSI